MMTDIYTLSSSTSLLQIYRSSGVQRVVLGHYSPTLLREHEEIDVTVDTNASPPRYSWLFSDKVSSRLCM